MRNNSNPEQFGYYSPSPLTQAMINLCHNPEGRLVSRFCAPTIRKWVTKTNSSTPIDLTLNNFNLRCTLSDNHSEKKFVFTPWRYDLQERTILHNAMKGGGTFIDIGANAGIYTLTAASAMTNNSGRIVAIEPNPMMMRRLEANIAANPNLFKDNIIVDLIPTGVADRESKFDLFVDRSNLGASSITKTNRSKASVDKKNVITISCQSLLSILTNMGIDRINALKIDIEGAEDIALRPYLDYAPESLLPRTIIIENSEHLWSIDLFSLIKNKGYKKIFSSRLNTIFQKEVSQAESL